MSGPAVLVTRAEPGASETAVRLREMGLRAIVSPALELRAVSPPPPLALEGAAGLVLSSANGVRFFAERSDQRDLVAWVVGPATEAAARAAGFTDIRSADGNANDLHDLIVSKASPDAGRLIHVANAEAAGDLVARLGQSGFEVDFAPLYEPVRALALTEPAKMALAAGRIAAILIHSAKGAEAFARLAGGRDFATVWLVAVSEKASEPLQSLDWAGTRIADKPNEDALLAALSGALTSP